MNIANELKTILTQAVETLSTYVDEQRTKHLAQMAIIAKIRNEMNADFDEQDALYDLVVMAANALGNVADDLSDDSDQISEVVDTLDELNYSLSDENETEDDEDDEDETEEEEEG